VDDGTPRRVLYSDGVAIGAVAGCNGAGVAPNLHSGVRVIGSNQHGTPVAQFEML
jgi:hypothetical protein